MNTAQFLNEICWIEKFESVCLIKGEYGMCINKIQIELKSLSPNLLEIGEVVEESVCKISTLYFEN